ncbi:MAG TPA: ATP-binding protein [Acidimicrobiia bacterium]|nr:ATP-binding protein [Acidimicrobiia bacterium]
MEHAATLELVPELRAPSAARMFAAETLSDWNVPPERVEVVQLVVSELVTNALRHAPDSSAVTLQLLVRDDCIELRVSDSGVGAPERHRPSDPGTGIESGRGVWIVDAFTDRWGTVPNRHGGKTVWCEIRTERSTKR